MTANIPAVLFNFLALAFFAVVAIGIALGAYAARSLKRAEQVVPVEGPVTVTAYESPAVTESAVESSID